MKLNPEIERIVSIIKNSGNTDALKVISLPKEGEIPEGKLTELMKLYDRVRQTRKTPK